MAFSLLHLCSVVVVLGCLFAVQSSEAAGSNWAVLLAGSNSFDNYRHQSDAYHAYQLLKHNGFPDDHIILMHYDDIANNPANPLPGVVINEASGPNVYVDIPKYWTGDKVTPGNFLGILMGNATGGPVLQSGPQDNVFIYMVDHGAPGMFCFPDFTAAVYADQLMNALTHMHNNNMYNKLVLYMEACEAGSMFEGILPKDMNIYVMTATNADLSSYACCMYDEVGTYLNDCWSIGWLNETEIGGITQSLEQQFEVVKKEVTESPATQYGELDWDSDPLSAFMAFNEHRKSSKLNPLAKASPRADGQCDPESVDNRDAKLAILRRQAMTKQTPEAKQAYLAELAARARVDQNMKSLADLAVTLSYGEHSSLHSQVLGSSIVKPFQKWDCYRKAVEITQTHCGKLTYHGLRYMRMLQNLCSADVHENIINAAAQKACSN